MSFSTNQGCADLGMRIPVQAFSPAEATAFLSQRTGLPTDGDPAAAGLAHEFGYLPLAPGRPCRPPGHRPARRQVVRQ